MVLPLIAIVLARAAARLRCRNANLWRALLVAATPHAHDDQTIFDAARDWRRGKPRVRRRWGHITQWNTTRVTETEFLFFEDRVFNAPIEHWDMRRVRSIAFMFAGARAFDRPIARWWHMPRLEQTQHAFLNSPAARLARPEWLDIK